MGQGGHDVNGLDGDVDDREQVVEDIPRYVVFLGPYVGVVVGAVP